jgi:hypothetical protein
MAAAGARAGRGGQARADPLRAGTYRDCEDFPVYARQAVMAITKCLIEGPSVNRFTVAAESLGPVSLGRGSGSVRWLNGGKS